MLVCAPIGMAGYAILVAWDVPAGVQYFSTYLIATACFLCTGGNIAWLSGNRAPDGKRAASLGIQLTLTNIGGVVVCIILAHGKYGFTDRFQAGQIYQTNSAPEFKLGHGWSLGCLAFAWCGWWVLIFLYRRREAWKDKMLAEGWSAERARGEGEVFTDRSPGFRYQF